MIKNLMVFCLGGLVSTVAMCAGFDGPFVQLGIGGSYASTKISGDVSQTTNVNGTSSQGSFNGLVSAGYSKSFGEAGFNLATNAFYVIGNQSAGNPNSTYGQGASYENLTVQEKLKNTFGISVEPGWNFSDTTLGYAKLAWVNSSFTSRQNYSDALLTGSDYMENKNINGFGYGLGLKQKVSGRAYVAVDLMGVTYGSTGFPIGLYSGTSIAVNQFLGFASVGYKF